MSPGDLFFFEGRRKGCGSCGSWQARDEGRNWGRGERGKFIWAVIDEKIIIKKFEIW